MFAAIMLPKYEVGINANIAMPVNIPTIRPVKPLNIVSITLLPVLIMLNL
jgi:hypothetical protein